MEADVGKEYLPHQQRVVEEHKDLRERRLELLAFLESPASDSIDIAECSRMQKQQQLMYELERVLQTRISNF